MARKRVQAHLREHPVKEERLSLGAKIALVIFALCALTYMVYGAYLQLSHLGDGKSIGG